MAETIELADDMLVGAEAIAEFLLGDKSKRRKIYHMADEIQGATRLPLFRLAGSLCGRKSTLLRYIAEREAGTGKAA